MKEHPLSTEEISALLLSQSVGNLGTVSPEGFPYVTPVHYVVIGDKIYIHGLCAGQKTEYIKANPKEAAQLIASDVNLPPDLLLKVFTKFNFNPAIHKDDISELKKSEVFMRDAGLIKTAVNIDTFVDLEIGRKSGLK